MIVVTGRADASAGSNASLPRWKLSDLPGGGRKIHGLAVGMQQGLAFRPREELGA